MSRVYYTDPPCKGCTDRKVGCHSTCISYKLWKNDSSELKSEPPIPTTNFSRRKKGWSQK